MIFEEDSKLEGKIVKMCREIWK